LFVRCNKKENRDGHITKNTKTKTQHTLPYWAYGSTKPETLDKRLVGQARELRIQRVRERERASERERARERERERERDTNTER
jgi:hypothetical protein